MTSIEIFTGDNWREAVLESDQLVLVDFQAPSHAPSFLGELMAERFLDRWGIMVRIGALDATRFMDLAFVNRVIELPTLALFDGGRVLKAFRGAARVKEMSCLVFTHTGLRETGVLSD